MNTASHKQELRAQVKTRISQLTLKERETASALICRAIIDSEEWNRSKLVLLYAALPDEVDLGLLVSEALAGGKQVALPVVDGDSLQFRLYDPDHITPVGKYNIQEPGAECPLIGDPDEIDLAIIPGRAFTRGGLRLGRGKGYYDRSLSSMRCPKWGVAFECQIVDELPTAPWDVRLDRVIGA